MTKETHALSCVACGAKCCKYMALEVDTPTCKHDYDNIRWYLHHKNVHAFIDHDNCWFIEFETHCDKLDENNMCACYEDRPKICRDHGDGEEIAECEFHADHEPHQVRFSSADEFERYLDEKGIDWRWKR
ncbi:MAG: YkgJ family cysteine cluster protein [Kiritimatiellae bacterium]|nr:YkgJ family cysteine cluster protein [Kiritimatiellia bacterium]